MVLSLFSLVVSATELGAVSLSESERLWLNEHQDIVIAYDGDFPPYSEQLPSGDFQGYAIDVVKILEQRLGVNFKVYPDGVWKNLFDAAKSREVDVVVTMNPIPERRQWFVFSDDYIFLSATLFARIDDHRFPSLRDVSLARIALVEGYAGNPSLLKKFPNTTPVLFQNMTQALSAVNEGVVDIYFGPDNIAKYLLREHELQNVEAKFIYEQNTSEQTFGIRKDWPELALIINKALASITRQEWGSLHKRWIEGKRTPLNLSDEEKRWIKANPELGQLAMKIRSRVNLSASERAWLKTHPVITLGFSSDAGALNFMDREGRPHGVLVDIYKEIEVATGLKFNLVFDTWSNIVQKVKDQKIDGFMMVSNPYAGSLGLLSSNAFAHTTPVVYARDNAPFKIESLDDLKGKKVVTLRNFKMGELALKPYEDDIELILVDDELKILQYVFDGSSDVAIGHSFHNYLIGKHHFLSVQPIYFANEYSAPSGMAVQSDMEELVSIINKGIKLIGEDGLNRILMKWSVAVPEESPLKLSIDEKEWLKAHPEIVLGTDRDWQPYVITDDKGALTGIEPDLIKRINVMTGANIRLVAGGWSELVEKAKRHEIDGLAVSSRHEERAEHFLFSESPYHVSKYIYNRSLKLSDMEELAGKRVGFRKGNLLEAKLLARVEGIVPVPAESDDALLSMLRSGQVDAAIAGIALRLTALEWMMGDIDVAFIVPDSQTEIVYSIRKDWPELHSIVNKALAAIPLADRLAILEKWGIEYRAKADSFSFRQQLTEEEKALLDTRPTVVARVSEAPPFHFTQQGNPAGYSVDLLNMLAKYAGFDLRYVTGIPWAEGLEHVRNRDGEVDLLLTAMNTEERREFMAFSKDYLKIPFRVFARTDDDTIQRFEDLIGKRVAIEKGYALIKKIRRDYPGIKLVELKDTEEALRAVSSGSADAYAGNETIANDTILRHGIVSLKNVAGTPFGFHFQAFGLRKDWSELASILDKAMETHPLDELRAIREKWGLSEPVSSIRKEKVALSEAEKKWLAEHPVIRTHFNHHPPYMYAEGGRTDGLVKDLLHKLAEKVDVNIEIPDTPGRWADILDRLIRHEDLDMLPAIMPTPKREEVILFTTPYINSPRFIFTRDDAPFIGSIRDLGERTIAVVNGFAVHREIEAKHPEIELVLFENLEAAIQAVAEGEAFAFVGDLTSTPTVINKLGLTNLKAAVPSGLSDHPLAIGVRKDWPELRSILDKAIKKITTDEMSAIINKWSTVKVEHGIRPGDLVKWGLIALLSTTAIVAVFITWNLQLKRRVDQRTSELRQSESYYRSIFDNSLYGIGLTGPDFMFRQVNKAFCKLLEYKEEELIGEMGIADITHPQDIGTSKSLVMKMITREIDHFILEKRYISRSGKVIEALSYVQGIYDNNDEYLGSNATIMDITQLKSIEAELRSHKENLERLVEQRTTELSESERRLKESQEFAKLGQWELNLVDDTLSWSDEIFRIFEIDQESFGASYEAFLNAIHPEDREAVDRAYSDSLVDRQRYEIVHRLLMADGRIKFVREQCRTEYDGDTPLYSIGTIQDITPIKESEEALRLANERLKELDKLKSMFIASMSHELRTPLNSILGFTGILLQELIGDLNTRQRDVLQRVRQAGRHLLGLISDVIDISKIEAGRIDTYAEDLLLDELLQEALDGLIPQAEAKGLFVVIEGEKGLKLHTDQQRLLQCVLNYLSNAVKFTEQGRITVKARGVEEQVEITVTDTGIGIAEEEQSRLFEAFERLDSHLRVKAGGTGLGLYLTKKIVTELLAGSIFLESRPGEGSTFGLRIPRKLPEPEK
ncbi:MAG: transporter substrate-binding domain-containing protein [Sedimenticola sp.]